MDGDVKNLLAVIRRENSAAHVETRRHSEAVAERVEKKVQTIAEAVGHLDRKPDAEASGIRDEMRPGFSEKTGHDQVLHAELDREK